MKLEMKNGITVYWLLEVYVFIFDGQDWDCYQYKNSNPSNPEFREAFLRINFKDPFKRNSHSEVSY